MGLEAQFPAAELIEALNGFSGIVFKWETDEQRYSITENGFCQRLLHPSDVAMAQRFLTIASDHRALQSAIWSNSSTHCPYRGALMTGISACFQRYDAQLDQLEKEWHTVPDQPTTSLLTLLRFEDVVCQLRKLWDRIDRKEMTYNSLLNHVSQQMDAGSQESRACFTLVFHSLLTPVYDDVWSWLMFGHLNHESRDIFFIREDGADVRLEATDLPVVVDNVVALKILFTGNLIRYFRTFCNRPHVFCDKEQEFASRFFALRQKAFDKHSFGNFVESIRKEAAKFSSQYVIHEEDILHHFSAIKDIFLTGHENLWIFFVDKVRDLSDKKCASWSDSRKDKYVRSTIETILLKSYCNQEDVDSFLSDLKFKFTCEAGKPLPEFRIEYQLPPLTQRIVKAHLMDKYQRVFNFMLQLFLVRQELSTAWMRHMRKRNSLCFVRHKLLLFVNHLSFYLKVNVFETQMMEFVHEIRVSHDYEEMQLRHASFVSTMFREMFLDYPAVEQILRRMFDFVHTVFSESAPEPTDDEAKKHERELSKMLHELDLLFCALRDYRFHSSLCQLLLKMRLGSE